MTNKTNKRFENNSIRLLVATVIIGNIAFLLWLVSETFLHSHKLEKFAHVGDFLSGVFASLAFIAVLYSLFLQIKENKEQKRDSERKGFEDTFFKMVSMQLEIVNGLEYTYTSYIKGKGNTIKGRQVFKAMFIENHSFLILNENELNRYKKVGDKCFTVKGYEDGKWTNSLQNLLDEKGLSVYPKVDFIGILDHYFRNLYRIIKFVHEQDPEVLSDEDKYKYIANNIRSILSEYELIMLFYNCLTKIGCEKFKPLIERYTLFKNIQQNLFTEIEDPCSDIYINKIFPMNQFEKYLDIDNLTIVDENGVNDTIKYKLQAFYKGDEIIDRQKKYQKFLKEQKEREKEYHRNIE